MFASDQINGVLWDITMFVLFDAEFPADPGAKAARQDNAGTRGIRFICIESKKCEFSVTSPIQESYDRS